MSITYLALSLVSLLVTAPGDEAAQWAIAPGHERVFGAVTVSAPGELPPGWTRLGVAIPRDRVVALYGPKGQRPPSRCEEAPLCLTLSHPSAAPQGLKAGPFSLTVAHVDPKTDPSRLLKGVASRITERNPPDPFKAIKVKLPEVVPPPPTSAEDPSPLPEGQTRETLFQALLTSDPDLLTRLIDVSVSDTEVQYTLKCDSGEPPQTVVVLKNRASWQSDPNEVTRSFFVQGIGGISDPPDLARRVHQAVSRADDGALRLGAQDVMASGEMPTSHRVLIGLSVLALLGIVIGMWGALWSAMTALRPYPMVLGVLGIGAALRLLIPPRMVEMGIGYQLTRYADTLTLPRYGAGTTTLHHAIFEVFGVDHLVMINTHRILGILTLPLATAAGLALLNLKKEQRYPVAMVLASLLSLTPILVKSDATESNLVPILFALWVAIWAWERREGFASASLTLFGLMFVVLSRPEMAVVGPGIWLILSRPWRRRVGMLGVLTPLVAVAAIQLSFIQDVVSWETSVQSLHLGKTLTLDRVLDVGLNNALFDPTIVPALLAPLALAALWIGGPKPTLLSCLIGGLGWVYIYAVDLSAASQPRLHIVVVIAWSIPAALALGSLWLTRRRTAMALAVALLLSASATIPTLWAPSNEDTQEVLFERLRESLPSDSPYVLATLTRSDAPDEPGHYTHRHVPSYRFKDGTIASLGDLERWIDGDAEVFYFQGTSCYAKLLRAARGESGLLPACAAVAKMYRLDPVWRDEVVNHGNPRHLELGYYGDDPLFNVGLWRVKGRAEKVKR